MNYKRIILFVLLLVIIRGCYLFEGTYTNLWQYGNNMGLSLDIANDTSYYLVSKYLKVEIKEGSGLNSTHMMLDGSIGPVCLVTTICIL